MRPFMHPANRALSSWRISNGSRQLFVGPASASSSEQMNVRSSTRATSDGLERARNEFGRFSGLSLMKVPASTSCCVRRSHSSCDPSHHSTRSGWSVQRLLHPFEQLLFFVGALSRPGIAVIVVGSYLRCARRSRVTYRPQRKRLADRANPPACAEWQAVQATLQRRAYWD